MKDCSGRAKFRQFRKFTYTMWLLVYQAVPHAKTITTNIIGSTVAHQASAEMEATLF